MLIYMRCVRTGKTYYSQHEGMTLESLRSLLTELGGSDIQSVLETEYLEQTRK